ncbi:hypothetical protein COT50_01220 [candidate division WWE3 bacterium CG08_land_8_20_14_0_20_41_10]|uniref:F-type ATPase subunit delta n=1 Tax=candidate division WWE3 bacterium CG08_land_8_20_14_0_20_41_10 TaxID=1975085 RepID=A0A2H0XC99_UNCKA|nr:MAG: hypothetical protein COT50_01220 [candidate division WWE3 bacterium CG08_land_8_20_14_0_20_41_10]
MPTENVAHKLAELVKTTDNKVLLMNQVHSLLTDLSKISSPSTQDIQNNYPFLSKILLECFPETSKKLEQKGLEALLVSLKSLEEIAFAVPGAVIADTINRQLEMWTTENIGTGLLTKCSPSTEIVGGLLISHAGHFLNLSLDKIIKEKIYA